MGVGGGGERVGGEHHYEGRGHTTVRGSGTPHMAAGREHRVATAVGVGVWAQPPPRSSRPRRPARRRPSARRPPGPTCWPQARSALVEGVAVGGADMQGRDFDIGRLGACRPSCPRHPRRWRRRSLPPRPVEAGVWTGSAREMRRGAPRASGVRHVRVRQDRGRAHRAARPSCGRSRAAGEAREVASGQRHASESRRPDPIWA